MRSQPRAAREILKAATAIAPSAVLPRRVGHGLAAVVTSNLGAGSQNSLLMPERGAIVHVLL